MLKKEKKIIPITDTIGSSFQDVYDSFDMDTCLCTDSKNRFKKLYRSEHEAEKIAKFIFDEQGVFLRVYPCRYSSGWHLSRR